MERDLAACGKANIAVYEGARDNLPDADRKEPPPPTHTPPVFLSTVEINIYLNLSNNSGKVNYFPFERVYVAE